MNSAEQQLSLESSCAFRSAVGPQLEMCLGSGSCWVLCRQISLRSEELMAVDAVGHVQDTLLGVLCAVLCCKREYSDKLSSRG